MNYPSWSHRHCTSCAVEWQQYSDEPEQACWACGGEGLLGRWRDENGTPLDPTGTATWHAALSEREIA